MNELTTFKQASLLNMNVQFAIANGLWLNATEVAKAYGKNLENYWRLESTKSYVEALSKSNSVESTDLKQTLQGRYGGTYLHPDLIVHFARWISDDFAIACDRFIKDEIIRVNNIKTEALLEQAHKEKLLAVAEAKKCKVYSDGSMSVRGIIQHLGLNVSEDFVWDALTYMGWNEDIIKATKYRRIPEGIPSYIGTPRGTQSPTFFPQVVKQAIIDYTNALENQK